MDGRLQPIDDPQPCGIIVLRKKGKEEFHVVTRAPL
jgi:hypothetical protein